MKETLKTHNTPPTQVFRLAADRKLFLPSTTPHPPRSSDLPQTESSFSPPQHLTHPGLQTCRRQKALSPPHNIAPTQVFRLAADRKLFLPSTTSHPPRSSDLPQTESSFSPPQHRTHPGLQTCRRQKALSPLHNISPTRAFRLAADRKLFLPSTTSHPPRPSDLPQTESSFSPPQHRTHPGLQTCRRQKALSPLHNISPTQVFRLAADRKLFLPSTTSHPPRPSDLPQTESSFSPPQHRTHPGLQTCRRQKALSPIDAQDGTRRGRTKEVK